jgi:hypothetical protein
MIVSVHGGFEPRAQLMTGDHHSAMRTDDSFRCAGRPTTLENYSRIIGAYRRCAMSSASSAAQH